MPLRVRKWLLYWACEGSFVKKKTWRLVSRALTKGLASEAKSGSLAWLLQASKIQSHSQIRQHVETHLAREGFGTLFEFVQSKLTPILRRLKAAYKSGVPEDARMESYYSKLASYHAIFAPFAAKFDESFLKRVLGEIDPAQSFTREGTARLLESLISDASDQIRRKYSGQWTRDLENLIAHGANGEGTLGPVVELLSAEARDTLQDNLQAVAVRRAERDDEHPVQWIATTLTESPPGALPSLDEGLVELIALPYVDVAAASLEAVLGPVSKKNPDFVPRHHRRLRRVLAVVRARGGYRKSSIFAAQLETLSEKLRKAPLEKDQKTSRDRPES